MEEGRRLENLSWRIWNRETFCCQPQPQLATTPLIETQHRRPHSKDVPDLSSSVESVASDETEQTEGDQRSRALPVNINRPLCVSEPIECHISSRGSQKHITSAGLEKMVISIKEKRSLQPLSPSIAEAVPMFFPTDQRSATSVSQASQQSSHSSSSNATSTAPTSSPDSARHKLQTVESDTSTELHTSHSIVRGFSPGHISSSYRSHTHLAPAPLPAKSILHAKTEESKNKSGMFLLGGSSGEEDSSFEERISTKLPQGSPITSQLRPTGEKKQTSFKDEVESRTSNQQYNEDEEVFESDDEEDVSESAIEEEDDSDWESSCSESGDSSSNEEHKFKKVEKRPNLVSHRSLLTTLMHQPERAAALAEMASRSQQSLHRSRTSSPNGPSVAASPDEDSTLSSRYQDTRSKPIIMTTSNIHPPALSPRTTRRNMLATELTESLRKHLLWERQQKNTTANAVLQRRHTAHNMANLNKYPAATGSGTTSKNNSWNHYFDHGLGEYHQKGW